jgi:hypothetical protein
MAAGLQVFNDSNIIQIDSTYQNYRVYSSGTATTTSLHPSFGGEGWYGMDFTANRPNSMLAVRSGVEFISLAGRDGNGNIVHTLLTKGSASFEYWLFDDGEPGNPGYGFEVFNEQGRKVFSAAERYLKVLNFTSAPMTLNQAAQSVNTPGYTPAVIHCSYSAFFYSTAIVFPGQPPQYGSSISAAAVNTRGGGMDWRPRVIQSAAIPRGVTTDLRFCFMVIDVNNI